ncbi:PEP/pyruvate-binding domain-containing protein [Neobacillus sp. MER 74]|uniref:PEP/pyruvate-binding domain-containing protein n=1 Tax=Neobacillus sp. MER 74 TaxID=2939566 RepID=UPI00203E1676|nr:PEP/pyruvate-binding domain-containing protein [Neobacillus sp. MER 74]MCM3117538.1 PEP/pyruvate-binding domain-containing protein [Neobacillus sp. MER 74]
MSLVSLSNAINYDHTLIGSKAMNLSKIKRILNNIPDGYVVTSDAFKEFLSFNHINTTSNENVQDEIIHAKFPANMELTIAEKFEALKKSSNYAVAVRSSSALEDLEGASFAGQYETILNVRTLEELLHSIKRCWASYFSSYVLDYAKNNSISLSDVQMGVLVQGMVNADVSGVIFSTNPVTHNQNEILINASYGLGEAIVDGSVTPDMFIINKQSNHIMKELGLKEIQIIPAESGNETVDVPIEQQEVFCLEEDLIHQLTDVTKEIEAYYQYPVDIEFAINNHQIFILQSRPITTLKGGKAS